MHTVRNSNISSVVSMAIFCLSLILFFIVVYNNFISSIPLQVDECISAWLVKQDISSMLSGTYAHQGTSPFYFIFLKAWSGIFGYGNDFVLKSFSLFIFFLSTIVLFKIASLFGKGKSIILIVCLFLFSDTSIIQIALQVRPYSLALLMVLFSVYYYTKFLRQSQFQYLQRSIVFAVLSVFSHYFFFAYLFLLQAHFFIFLFWKLTDKAKFLKFNLLALLSLVIFVPHIFSIVSIRSEWSMPGAIGSEILRHVILPDIIFYILLASLGLLLMINCRNISAHMLKQILFFFTGSNYLNLFYLFLFFVPPFFLLVLEFVFNVNVFMYRYVFYHKLGLLLIILQIFSLNQTKLENVNKSNLVLLLSSLLVLLLTYHEIRFRPYQEFFKFASRAILNAQIPQKAPVFFNTNLVEAYSEKLFFDKNKRKYFLSPLNIYPVGNRKVYLIPPNINSPEYKAYMEALVGQNQKEFILYTAGYPSLRDRTSINVADYYGIVLSSAGYKRTSLFASYNTKVDYYSLS